MTTIGPLTPHAFDARMSQLLWRGHHETDFGEWYAFFESEVDPYGGINERHEVCECTRYTLVGAWRDDGGLYAGNREELIAHLGEAEVKRWEAYIEETHQ